MAASYREPSGGGSQSRRALFAAYHAFLFVGQQHTTAAAAILVSLSPVLSTGFARRRPLQTPSPGFGIVGVVVGLSPSSSSFGRIRPACSRPASWRRGSFSVLRRRSRSAASSPAVSIPRCRSRRWKPGRCSAARSCYTSSVAIGEMLEPTAWTHPEAIGALAYLSLGASAIGFLVYFDLLGATGAVEINMVSYVAPIVTAVVGWLYLGEVVDTATLIGFGLIAVSFCLVKRRAIRREFGRSDREARASSPRAATGDGRGRRTARGRLPMISPRNRTPSNEDDNPVASTGTYRIGIAIAAQNPAARIGWRAPVSLARACHPRRHDVRSAGSSRRIDGRWERVGSPLGRYIFSATTQISVRPFRTIATDSPESAAVNERFTDRNDSDSRN